MTNIDSIENQIPVNLTESSIRIVTDRMKEATDSLYHTSKEKYDLKARLIEEADDMTTKEKLDALDQNYDRHNQEVWQGIVIFGVLSLSIIGIAAGINLFVLRVTVLAKEKFENIDRYICAFPNMSDQILSDNLAIKLLTKFLIQFCI